MRRVILMALLLVLAAMPVQGRFLLVVGNPPAADVTTYTGYINKTFPALANVMGQAHDLVLMEAFTISGVDTVWTCETMAASGNYRYAVMINLPEFDAGLKSNSNCKAKGLNKFGQWIGPSDTAFPLPVVVLLEGEAYATGSIFTDSTGVHAVAASCASEYESYTNADGDLLYLSTHCNESFPEAYLDIANQTHVTPLSWRADSTLSSVYVPSNWWFYEKDNGYRVYIIQHAHFSGMAGAIIATMAMHDRVTPLEICAQVAQVAYPNTGDSTGYAANTKAFLDYCVTNSFKIDMFISEPAMDAFGYGWMADRMKAHPEIFNMMMDTRRINTMSAGDWFGQVTTGNTTSSTRRAGIALAFDSVATNADLFGYIDTTSVIGYVSGTYGANNNQAYPWGQTCMSDMHYAGIRNIYHGRITGLYSWPRDKRYIYPGSMRYYVGTDEMRAYRISSTSGSGYAMYTVADPPTQNNQAFTENSIVWWAAGIREGLAGSEIYAGAHCIFSPGFLLSGLYGFETDAGSYPYGVDTYNNANAWAVDALNRTMTFYNNVADTYSAAGQRPMRNCWVKEVKYGRKTGMAFPNSHVTVR